MTQTRRFPSHSGYRLETDLYAVIRSLYRVTVDTRQHCTDNTEDERPSNTNIRATLRCCTVGKLSAHS